MLEMLPTKARQLNDKLVKLFDEGYEGGPEEMGCSQIMDVCRVEDSDSASTVYLMAQTQRGIYARQEDGSLRVESPKHFDTRVTNQDRGVIVRVPTKDLRDDKIGQYAEMTREMGVRAASDPLLALEDLLIAGDTLLGPGDVPFFGTHKVDMSKSGSPTWTNKAVIAGGLTIANFETARTSMRKFPSATAGKAIGAKPTHILCAPEYEGVAIDICTNEFPTGLQGARNRWKGEGLKYIVVSNWTRANLGFMLIDAKSPAKRPIVFQERMKISFGPSELNGGIDIPTSGAWQRGYYDWVIGGEYGVGFLYPETAMLVTTS